MQIKTLLINCKDKSKESYFKKYINPQRPENKQTKNYRTELKFYKKKNKSMMKTEQNTKRKF